MAHDDGAYMRRAIELAHRGWGHTAPNPMVGAVLVRDGTIVGEGYHARFGGEHAEVAALRQAGNRAHGATLYVTLEPCRHWGKTPPCVGALLQAGVRRVVAATRDPTSEAGGGLEELARAGVLTEVGPGEAAVLELNAAFFNAQSTDRPWVTLKLAISIDGAVANAARTGGRLTGPEAEREVHRLRAGSDGVAVGIGTVLVDDPLLTVRAFEQPRRPPARIVFDRDTRTPLSARLLETISEAPVIVIARDGTTARAAALSDAGATVIEASEPGDALRKLRRRGLESIICEGGPTLAGSLLSDSLVDRLVIFQAPILLGAGSVPAFSGIEADRIARAPRLRAVERRSFGDDFMTVYALGDR